MAPASQIPAAACAWLVPNSCHLKAFISPTKALLPLCSFAEQRWRDYVHSFVALQQLIHKMRLGWSYLGSALRYL